MKYTEIEKPEDVFNFNRNELTLDFFMYLFGNRVDGGPRFKRDTPLLVKKNTLYNNKEDIKTCLSNYLVNYYLFNEDVFRITGFINKKISKDVLEGFEDKIAKALLVDELTVEAVIDYLDAVQMLGFGLNDAIVGSLTVKTMIMPDSLYKERDKMIKENQEAIDKGDPTIADKISKEMIKKAKEYIGDDNGLDLYESGSKATLSNNFKNLYLMRGAIKDPNTGGFGIATTSYSEGISKKDMDLLSNAMVSAEFAKGVGTQKGGYLTKKYIAAFQTVVLGEQNSDCGSQHMVEITLTKFNHKMFLYRNVYDGKKKIYLDDKNIKSYIGRSIKIRDPLFCSSDEICNECAGNMYYYLGIKNIGLTAAKVTSSIMNKSLKMKHDSNLSIYTVNSVNELVL